MASRWCSLGVQAAQRERTLVTGPSGSGKSTLFRAIAGIWPFGRARRHSEGASLMMLPQRPYFRSAHWHRRSPIPRRTGLQRSATRDVLKLVGLPALAERLDEEGHWNRTLSLGEQQRLGVARALLHTPQYLFLDEATASLDEPSEALLYQIIVEKLPDTTLVSIGHRTTLEAFHQRKVSLVRSGGQFTLGTEADTSGVV